MSSWPVVQDDVISSAGGAASLTIAPISLRVLGGVLAVVGYDADPPAGALFTIKNGADLTNVIFSIPITKSGPAPIPIDGFNSNVGEGLKFELSAGGGSIKGYINVSLKKI